MAQTYTKNYNADTFPELVSDLQSAYEWHEVQTAEDGLTSTFFVTENIYFKVLCSNNALSVRIGKNNADLNLNFGNASNYLLAKITKTSKVFCFSYMLQNSSGNISPTGILYNVVIGNAVNQLTKAEETALAFAYQYNFTPQGFILSSDNLTGNVSIVSVSNLSSNLGSEITTMQNWFSKYSECIMKDVYVLSALQFPSLSFNDCTLNNKKYYMNGAILLADD